MAPAAQPRVGSVNVCGSTPPARRARDCTRAVQCAQPQSALASAPCSRAPWGHQRCTRCGADPGLMQDLIVGGAVTAAVGSAMFNGLKKSQVEMCDLCKGVGGAQCFVCEGSGKRSEIKKEVVLQDKNRFFGNPRECKTCRGSGLIACRKCKGTGYLNGL